jgi:hypothetical protein
MISFHHHTHSFLDQTRTRKYISGHDGMGRGPQREESSDNILTSMNMIPRRDWGVIGAA